MNKADFKVDLEKCIGCRKCVKTCPGGILFLNDRKKAQMKDFEEFGWNGCWKCEHCLAVCPTGAISIFGKNPANSLSAYDRKTTTDVLNSILANRHSCRRFQDKNVEPHLIDEMLDLLANAPNGENKQQVAFTMIDDKKQMEHFRQIVYLRMEELAQNGIYPKGFDKASYEDMKHWEETVRPDMLFCSAPHILIPHAPLGNGTPVPDTIIAGTYFEMLCASRGLGAVMMTFPLDVLSCMPEIKTMLEIPENHYVGMILGFGYPEITYARGVQKKMDQSRIHRLRFS